jgi:hypothetical protein
VTPSGGESRRREWLTLALLLLMLGGFALPLALHESGRNSTATILLYEDGVYEWVGTLACLVAGALFVAAWRARRNAWLLLFAVGMLALFGEELSWGQRLFGFDAPPWFMEHNSQRDLTVHNLHQVGAASDRSVDLLLAYLFGLPLLLAAFPSLGALARRVRVPVPSLSVAFLAAVAKVLNHLADRAFGLGPGVDDWLSIGEMFETALEVLLLAVAIECWQAARAGQIGPDRARDRVPEGGGDG